MSNCERGFCHIVRSVPVMSGGVKSTEGAKCRVTKLESLLTYNLARERFELGMVKSPFEVLSYFPSPEARTERLTLRQTEIPTKNVTYDSPFPW